MSDITLVLEAVGRGEDQAAEDLLPLVYDELRRLAGSRMAREGAGQTLQATALVHEAWLRLAGDGSRKWENAAHFFGAASEAMRRILVDRARHKASLKCGGRQERLEIESLDLAAAAPDARVLMIEEALSELEQEDPAIARVVVLKFFGGLTNKEVARTLDVTERTIERDWAFAKSWLWRRMQGGL